MSISCPRVTVIIPAYNRSRYIQQTLDSVFIQDYLNIELIAIDDGSNDGTYEILKKYQSNGQLTLLHHDNRANKGQSASINLGLEKSSGEFICILDSDDLFAKEKISKQVSYLLRNPSVGLVYGNGKAIDEDNNELYTLHGADHIETNDPNALLLDCYFCLPVNALVRADVYKQVGRFNESFRAAQDHDMQVRMAEIAEFAYIPDCLFYYRKHDDSISNKGALTRWKNGIKILEMAKTRYPYNQSTIKKRLAVLNYRLAKVYMDSGHYISAMGYYLHSAILDPRRSIAVLTGRDTSI